MTQSITTPFIASNPLFPFQNLRNREGHQKMEEETPDLISTLPKEILHHIISLITFKEAIQTTILSHTWRSLISPAHANLESKQSLTQILQNFTKSNECSQLRITYRGRKFAIATKGAHGELHIDFSKHCPLLLPCFSSSCTLGMMNGTTSFCCIKILCLRSVSSFVGSVVDDLCSWCHFLVSLRIEKCSGLEKLCVESGERLEVLEVVDCVGVASLVVSGCSLKCFLYRGVFAVIEVVGVPNLVEVTLDVKRSISLEKGGFDCEDALSLLFCVKDVEILTVSSWLIETLCRGGVIFSKLDFQFSKLKNLRCLCSKISTKTRDSVACFFHVTPSLEELIVEIDQKSIPVEYPLIFEYWHEPHLWKDYATVKHEACILKDLNLIKINGFTRENDELLLIDLLFHIAINVKEIIVASPESYNKDSWRVKRIPFCWNALNPVDMNRSTSWSKVSLISRAKCVRDYIYSYLT